VMVVPVRLVMRLVDVGRSVRDSVGYMKLGMTDRTMRIACLWFAARMASACADDRDDPRDDRAKKRQESDGRIHAVSPSSC
jgi:hypothetical protein